MNRELKLQCLNTYKRIEIFKSQKAVSITIARDSSVTDYMEISFNEARKLRDYLNEFIEANNE